MDTVWRRICWLKEKSEQREKEKEHGASNFYRREYSALLWAFDYITAHNNQLKESFGKTEQLKGGE